jgi:hypothetical protein
MSEDSASGTPKSEKDLRDMGTNPQLPSDEELMDIQPNLRHLLRPEDRRRIQAIEGS